MRDDDEYIEYQDVTVDHVLAFYQGKIEFLTGELQQKLLAGDSAKKAEWEQINLLSSYIRQFHEIVSPVHDHLHNECLATTSREFRAFVEDVRNEREDVNDPDIQSVIDDVREVDKK